MSCKGSWIGSLDSELIGAAALWEHDFRRGLRS